MTTISAKAVADSISPDGVRLTSLQLRYPRFVHAEVMTHRVFSRNASSSRAIPVSRLIDDIERDPAEPIYWGRNQSGMQAYSHLFGLELASAKAYWREDREHSILMARAMAGTNAHKQIVNRLIENHGHINLIVTSTEWENFFELRDHPDAQPEIAALAASMKLAMIESEPRQLIYGQWHRPYVEDDEADAIGLDDTLMVSTARCARVSYMTHQGLRPRLEEDLALAHGLVIARPLHASPAEHQAQPKPGEDYHRNLRGWSSFRVHLEARQAA